MVRDACKRSSLPGGTGTPATQSKRTRATNHAKTREVPGRHLAQAGKKEFAIAARLPAA